MLRTLHIMSFVMGSLCIVLLNACMLTGNTSGRNDEIEIDFVGYNGTFAVSTGKRLNRSWEFSDALRSGDSDAVCKIFGQTTPHGKPWYLVGANPATIPTGCAKVGSIDRLPILCCP